MRLQSLNTKKDNELSRMQRSNDQSIINTLLLGAEVNRLHKVVDDLIDVNYENERTLQKWRRKKIKDEDNYDSEDD